MNAPATHPAPARLLDFAHGRLHGEGFAELEEHLAGCDECCAWIGQQPDHTLIFLAREVATLGFRQGAGSRAGAAEELQAALAAHPRYRVLEQIGSGGMGSVYKAEHRLMQRIVALKIVHPALLTSGEAVERFHREVRLAARLSHPHIVTSYDADQAGDLHILVMEYVAGASLDETIAAGGLAPIAQACEWMRQTALGLQHAHEQGMVHRDIKPHNLMITRHGQVKILDFGLTRVVAEQSGRASGIIEATAGNAENQTQAGTVLGTPDYIAPEQIANSRAADIRSDIYSLGCTLFFTLTGRAPFAGGGLRDKLEAHVVAEFPSLAEIRPDAPPELVRILARMTAKRPEDRYQTPREVAADLAALAGATAAPAVVPPPVPPPVARRQASTIAQPSPPAAPTSAAPILAFSSGNWAIIGGILVLLLVLGVWGRGLLSLATSGTSPPAKLLVLLPSRGLWFPDYQELSDAAKAQNTELVLASLSDSSSQTLYTSPPGVAVPDVRLGPEVRAEPFDGLICIGYDTSEFQPGGAGGEDVSRLLLEFQRQKKVVAALCAGQRILAQHGAFRGKRVAPTQSVRSEEITVEGGAVAAEPVVTDGLVVTASEAKDAPEFLAAIKNLVRP